MSMVERLFAGDTLDFTDSVADYPASDGWTLVYRLVPTFTTPVQTPIELTASTYEVTGYRVTASAGATATWSPGVYTWARWVEDATRRVTFDEPALAPRRLEVLQDPATATAGFDTRTQAETALDEALAAYATFTQSNGRIRSYTINNRSVTYETAGDIILAINFWKIEVARERRAARLAAGLGDPRNVGVRFGRAS